MQFAREFCLSQGQDYYAPQEYIKKFWGKYGNLMPILKEAARVLYSVPSSSIECEKGFSKMGTLKNK